MKMLQLIPIRLVLKIVTGHQKAKLFEKFLFWLIKGEQNFCTNCTYVIKVEKVIDFDCTLFLIPTSSDMEIKLA